MIEVTYGVIQIDGDWVVISDGLRVGPYKSRSEAEGVARRMADKACGLDVQLHLQDEIGELHSERHVGQAGGQSAPVSKPR